MKRGPFPLWPAFPDPRVLRPAPTAARPPTPLPGFAGYRRGIASRAPQATGPRPALPGSKDDHPHVQRPLRRRVPQRPLLDQERFPWPSPCTNRLGSPSCPPLGGSLDDACSGFTHVADRTVAPTRFAPGLSTTHGGIATGDPGVSPDRTHTGRPPRTCRSYVTWFSFPSWRRSSPGALARSDSARRGSPTAPRRPSKSGGARMRDSGRLPTYLV